MKNEKIEKPNKLAIDILKDLDELKKKIHSDFIRIDIALLETKIKKIFNIK